MPVLKRPQRDFLDRLHPYWAAQATNTYERGHVTNGVARVSQDALIGEHVEIQQLLLAHKGKVFRKGIGLVEYTVPEAQPG